MVFNSFDADDVALAVDVYEIFERVLVSCAGVVPRLVQVLHKSRVSFEGCWVADLLHGHVAACADDIANVDEVVAYISGQIQSVLLEPMSLGERGSGPMKPSLVISACSPSWPSCRAMIAPETLSGPSKTAVAPGLTVMFLLLL